MDKPQQPWLSANYIFIQVIIVMAVSSVARFIFDEEVFPWIHLTGFLVVAASVLYAKWWATKHDNAPS